MGYNTDFNGELKFKNELTTKALAHLNKFLSKDRRYIGFENNEEVYVVKGEYWYHIDLELLEDFSGLKWNGSEKTYDLHHIVNFLTRQMRIYYPNFELEGQLEAQGESMDDRWILVMIDGLATVQEVTLIVTTDQITCPNCDHKFSLEKYLWD